MTNLPTISRGGMPGFFLWLQTRQPYLWRAVKGRIPREQMGEAVETPSASTSPDWLKNILTTASQVYLTKQQIDAQKRILDMQLQRAAAGLPPLDIDPQTMGLPGPSVSVGVTPDVKKMLWIGGAVVAGFLLLSAARPRRA